MKDLEPQIAQIFDSVLSGGMDKHCLSVPFALSQIKQKGNGKTKLELLTQERSQAGA